MPIRQASAKINDDTVAVAAAVVIASGREDNTMGKFISYEKLSKKKQRELDAKRRGDWGGINPVTRRPASPKAYNRKKARKWSDESSMTVPFAYIRLVVWEPRLHGFRSDDSGEY